MEGLPIYKLVVHISFKNSHLLKTTFSIISRNKDEIIALEVSSFFEEVEMR
jgi:hypothetical protein